MKVSPCVAALGFVQTASEQPSLSPLSPALPECAAVLACVAGPVASTTPTRTKVRNKAACLRIQIYLNICKNMVKSSGYRKKCRN